MSSHCFIKTSKYLEANEVEKDLKDIIHRKFSDLLKIETNVIDGEICDWNIIFDDVRRFPICLKNPNNLIFEHPDNSWANWAQLVVENELVVKYNGRVTDEEYPQQEIKPLLKRHDSFRAFLEATIHHSPQWKKALIAIEISYLPEALKKL